MSNYDCPHCTVHEIFAAIGYLVLEFANFEGRLGPVLALMLNENGDQASAILGQVDSFAYKWGTIVGVAQTLKDGDRSATRVRVANAVLSITDEVRDFASFRNKLAHSGSRIHPPELWIITKATTTKRGVPKSEPVTEAMVQGELDKIRVATKRLDDVIVWDLLTSDDGLMRAFRCSSGPAN